jgi:hypothetical protein
MNYLILIKKRSLFFLSFLFIVAVIIYPANLFADFMESATYKIQTDSLNFGGMESNSSEYKLSDSLGEIGTGYSNSSNYYLHAGYWQMQESFISISVPSDLAMTSMGGISVGSSEGSMSWLVITDNTAGYSMTIASSTSPTLKSSNDSFADYSPVTVEPDYTFINASNSSSFGFSPEGVDVTTRFRDNGSACNLGELETVGKCWDGISLTSKIIAGSNSSNMPSGSNTVVRFRAENGDAHIQTSGEYSATITITAITL